MNILDKLIKDYLDGEINVETFTDKFTIIFSQETDYNSLSPEKYKMFKELGTITSRYSPYQDEIEKYKAHYGEDVVKAKAKEVWEMIKE